MDSIPESSLRIVTILSRIQLSVLLCIPIYIFTVIFSGITTGLFLPTLGVVATTAFGATLIITTQRDHIRHLQHILNSESDPSSPALPTLCDVKTIAWCLASIAVWGLEVGLIVVSLVLMVVEGPVWPSVVILGVLHGLFAAGQAGLLFSVAMLCIEERKESAGIHLGGEEGEPAGSP